MGFAGQPKACCQSIGELRRVTITLGQPTAASALHCPGVPAAVNESNSPPSINCTHTHTVHTRWDPVTRPTGDNQPRLLEPSSSDLPIYQSTNLPIYQSTNLPIYQCAVDIRTVQVLSKGAGQQDSRRAGEQESYPTWLGMLKPLPLPLIPSA